MIAYEKDDLDCEQVRIGPENKPVDSHRCILPGQELAMQQTRCVQVLDATLFSQRRLVDTASCSEAAPSVRGCPEVGKGCAAVNYCLICGRAGMNCPLRPLEVYAQRGLRKSTDV